MADLLRLVLVALIPLVLGFSFGPLKALFGSALGQQLTTSKVDMDVSNMAQRIVKLHDDRAVFDFCGGMMFQLVLSDKLRADLLAGSLQPVVYDVNRMSSIPNYSQSSQADNVNIFYGREVRKVQNANGGMGFVLQLSSARDDPESWSAAEISEYNGWAHDSGRKWRKAKDYNDEGNVSYEARFGPSAFGLHHRFYWRVDRRGLWLSAEDGCEGVIREWHLHKQQQLAAQTSLSCGRQMGPFEGVVQLYCQHFFFTFISRMFDFAIVFLIADISHNNLYVIAVNGLVSTIVLFLFMPPIGVLLDSMNRLKVLEVTLLSKVVAVSCAYGICGYCYETGVDATSNKLVLAVLPVICSLATLSFNTISQAVEKDWIVVLADGSSEWLTSTNARLSQIDLLCKSLSPAVTGLLFYSLSTTEVTLALLALNTTSAFLLYYFMKSIYEAAPQLRERASKKPAAADAVDATAADSGGSSGSLYSDFLCSGCAGVMVSYTCLYLTVLSFGSVMTVYLRFAGIDDHWIGISRGSAAFWELTGALLFPWLSRRFGLRLTGRIAIWHQFTFVFAAAASFYLYAARSAALLMIAAVLISRIGLWTFDLVARQICQETIPARVRGRVNGQWRALTALFEVAAYALAIRYSDPREFSVLASVSAAMLLVAAVVYTASTSVLDDRRYTSLLLSAAKSKQDYNSVQETA